MAFKQFQEQEYNQKISAKLNELKTFFITENTGIQGRFQEIRSVYDQYDDQDDYVFEDSNSNMTLHDVRPREVVNRCVSGFGTYHLSPRDRFFSMDAINLDTVREETIDTDEKKALSDRTKEIHSVYQNANNFYTSLQVQRDKITFGIGGKIIAPDEELVARFHQYPPEDLARGSSNGLIYNIFGVREKLSAFQQRQRWPNPFMPEAISRSDYGVDVEDKETVYHFSIPKDVLSKHLSAGMEDKAFIKYFKRMFKMSLVDRTDKKKPWINLWFTDQGILSIEDSPYSDTIISQFALGTNAMSMGRGLGSNALLLAKLLAEVQTINLAAFERTFMPPWMFPDEKQTHAVDLGRDGIIFTSEDNVKPGPLSLNADIRAVIEFQSYYHDQFEKQFYLDLFTLIEKSRMTKAETQIRDDASLRKAGVFVTTDEREDLGPTILTLNRMIHDRLKRKEQRNPLSKHALKAHYISPLAMAHRTNTFMFSETVLGYLDGVNNVLMNDGPIGDVVNLIEDVKETLTKAGKSHMIRPMEKITELVELRESRTRAQTEGMEADNVSKLSTSLQAMQDRQTQQQNQATAQAPQAPVTPIPQGA